MPLQSFYPRGVLFLAASVVFSINLVAQLSQTGAPSHWGEIAGASVNWMEFDALDLTTLRAEDEATAQFKDAPWRFGIEHPVAWNTSNSGAWSEEAGFDVWRLGVRAELATNWSFYLSEFDIPKGGELYVWNADRTEYLGAFTHLNHKEWGGLAIGLLEGAGVVLEYRQPQNVSMVPSLQVAQVVQGYRSLLTRAEALNSKSASEGPFGNSGACNINVNCPEGADWQVEKKAVAIIVNGGFAACTGSLVNNTSNDGTPYFLTANHCLGNPNTWTYYFNHESSTCTGTTGPTNMSISGGALLMSDGGSDVALIELSSTPPSSWNVEYAGWDASGSNPENATGIHHPSGDLKKICFEEDSPYTSSTGGAQVWWINQWEAGVTEPGSSGSPLFDQNHRIIGQLYGGAAACSGSVNNGAYDFYGRFDVSWGLGVSDYLDPQNTGLLVLDSYPTGYNTDLGCTDPSACNYSPEAITDDGSCLLTGTSVTMTVLTDNYPAETTWTVVDANGETVMSGGPYSSNATTYTSEECLADGCYTLTVFDSYGDGLCCGYGEGSYSLSDESGAVYASGASFDDLDLTDFCLETVGDIEGCTDSSACNFDPTATLDDGSCTVEDACGVCGGPGTDTDGDGIADCNEIAGCTDSAGCNYLAEATDSAACTYPEEGLDCNGEPTSCAEDLNSNGMVEVSDVLILLADFGCDNECSVADVNGDGMVSVADILLLLAAFGEDC
ncbi:MAG: trypsin-like peptidase domain-containing protein [Flavobacteriales bacterium]|nr:trypsin-like peptidase domain-containing protein [Flavobacteriales bacterium]